jgi:hypothetical protein
MVHEDQHGLAGRACELATQPVPPLSTKGSALAAGFSCIQQNETKARRADSVLDESTLDRDLREDGSQLIAIVMVSHHQVDRPWPALKRLAEKLIRLRLTGICQIAAQNQQVRKRLDRQEMVERTDEALVVEMVAVGVKMKIRSLCNEHTLF